MLFYLGKDVCRWLEQCMECVERIPELAEANLQPQSFAGLLTADPPVGVKEKLIRWGVVDYPSIFSRALGLNALFAEPPGFPCLSEEFLRNYHRYADALYHTYVESQPHHSAFAKNFRFELYASGEYSRMLESEWENS
jgi:hypothetical protein